MVWASRRLSPFVQFLGYDPDHRLSAVMSGQQDGNAQPAFAVVDVFGGDTPNESVRASAQTVLDEPEQRPLTFGPGIKAVPPPLPGASGCPWGERIGQIVAGEPGGQRARDTDADASASAAGARASSMPPPSVCIPRWPER